MQTARRLSPETKMWACGPGSTTIMYVILGPFGPDSQGKLQRQIEAHMAATGKDFLEASLEVSSYNGRAVE